MEFISELSFVHFLYFAGVMALAGLIHGSMGLGFPMIATPLIAIFLDVRLAILITLLPTITVNVASIWGGHEYKKSFSEYWPLFAFCLLGSIIGSYLLAIYDPSPFRLLLAALILFSVWNGLSNRFSSLSMSKENLWLMMGFGITAGISGGITNVMVAILIIYFLALGLSKPKMVPILNTCFLIGKASQVAVLSGAGMVTLPLIYYTIPLSLIGFIALIFGQRLGEKISADNYRTLLYLLLVVLAGTLIVQFFLDKF